MTSTCRFTFAARHNLPQSNYVCLQCRLRASTTVRTTNPPFTLTYTARRQASWIDTQKLRKKIWGTETPPGQDDPYGKESVFDKRRREREQEMEEERELESEPEGQLESVPSGEGESPEGGREYVKATTAEGLKTVGGRGWGTKNWEEAAEENQFKGFMKSKRSEGRDDIFLAVHRALVETYLLKEAGLPLVMDYYSIDPTDDYADLVARGANFEQDSHGQIKLVLESDELRDSILECVTPRAHDESAVEEEEIEEETISDEEAELEGAEERPSNVEEDDEINLEYEGLELPVPEEEPLDSARSSDLVASVPASDSWRNLPLEDAAIKFALLKRVMQLTGRRIPDPDISAITTPGILLVHLVKKPKPKKIAEALLNSNPVAQLPNVQILARRYGPIDREIEAGRWKVIEKELDKRGLPVR